MKRELQRTSLASSCGLGVRRGASVWRPRRAAAAKAKEAAARARALNLLSEE